MMGAGSRARKRAAREAPSRDRPERQRTSAERTAGAAGEVARGPLRVSRRQFQALGGRCGTARCDATGEPSCAETSGRWLDGPRAENFHVAYDRCVDVDVATELDVIPVGAKFWLQFIVTADITGRLECTCDNGVDHGTPRVLARRFTISVPVRVPVKVYAIRLNPLVVAIMRKYKIDKYLEYLRTYGGWIAPAVELVRDSADLICEGRFDPSALVRHLGDIVLHIDGAERFSDRID